MELIDDQEWVTRLKQPDNSAAIEELRLRLVRGLTYALSGRVPAEQLDDLVEDFAQDSVLRILAALDTFRGESRFLTWATKVAVRLAFSELRRKRWQDVSLEGLVTPVDENLEESNTVLADPAPGPEAQVNRDMLLDLVQRLIDEELTPRQRDALQAVMTSGLPVDELAHQMGTTRNAFYKLVHDARQRLMQRLAERGLSPQDLLMASEEK
jgi:RNA polymerase sigma-70 factor, ECF subfamily